MRRAFLATLALLLLLVGGVAIAGSVPVPPLTARVTDQTGTLDAAQSQSLDSTLAALEAGKGSQIAILIVPTTGDETIEQYSIRVTDAWKLGRKGVDDGILVLVAKDDHKVRIEVGRGLEGAVPDALANRIIDEAIVPKFKQGDFAGGLQDGIARLVGLVNGEPLPPPKASDGGDRSPRGDDGFGPALFAFFIARVLFQAVRPMGRGLLVGGVVGVVAAIAGAPIVFAGIFALVGFVLGLLSNIGSGGYAGRGGWGGWGGSSSGGWGGGGFSGGGGGFSGGGASGGW